MFTSAYWLENKWAKEQNKKNEPKTVIMPSFWNTFIFYLMISSPLVHVLCMVDGEKKKAPMGYIYEVMTRAKETIVKSFLGCDAPKPGGPLTTRQPAEYKWRSGYPTPL